MKKDKKPKNRTGDSGKAGNSVDSIKKKLIETLELTLGVVTPACKEVGISRTAFYNYVNRDLEFAKAVEDVQNIALDFAESKLYKHIKNDNLTATIFYLKTKGSKRGFSENREISINLPEGTGVLELPAMASLDDWAALVDQANASLEANKRDFEKNG